MKIVIVDYGMGNLRSVQKALEHVGHAADISSDPAEIMRADKVILPGVGAFPDAIRVLREKELAGPIAEFIAADKPFLGICLGLQLLFSRSHEDGVHDGLGAIAGDVVRFRDRPGLKIPHMGWNSLAFREGCPLFAGLPQGAAVYFVHGYYAEPADAGIVAATADYPGPFAAAVWRGNCYATQFHPEKSQAVGLRMLKNFAEG